MGGASGMGGGRYGVTQKSAGQKAASAERRAAKDAARKANGGVVNNDSRAMSRPQHPSYTRASEPKSDEPLPLTDAASGDAME